ncbi:MAG: hypothetical protein WDO24_04730 [Pseudomonadota bacterium]
MFVEAYADPSPGFSANADRSAALIDTGSASTSQTVTLDRDIVWNAKTVVLPAPDPTLIVDAAGNFATQQNITATHTAGITVADIVNGGAFTGSATFSITASYLDALPSGVGTVEAHAIIAGASNVLFQTGFKNVNITNNSNQNLTINAINPINPTTDFAASIHVNVGNATGFSTVSSTSAGTTTITILNTAGGDITLNKTLQNNAGQSSTTIKANTGNILAGTSQNIITNAVTLMTTGGHIGSAAAPINIRSTSLTASAAGDIAVSEAGTLNIVSVASTTGVVTLSAGGSILDGAGGAGTNIVAPTLVLTSNGGTIGIAADALRIGAPGAATTLTATARNGVTLTDLAGALDVALGVSVSGDITLAVPDLVAAGQDIVLASTSVIHATSGAITLDAGDNVSAAAGSIIQASTSVTIAGDFGNADPGAGTVIDLRGTLSAPSAQITGDSDGDLVSLTNLAAGTALAVNLGAGANDRVQVGSKAAASPTTTNTGGILAGIAGTLTVTGNGSTLLQLDDTGDGSSVSGVLTASALTGLGMGGSIHYATLGNLQIALGNGADTMTVQGTAGGTTTAITLGTVASSVVVQGADNTTNALAGLLQLTGNGANDSLQVVDTGATGGATGNLTQSRLTGLGMGGSQPLANGIAYSGFSALGITLGGGADTLTIDGDSAVTTVTTGGGGDVVSVGPTLANLAAALTVQEGGGSDSLQVTSSAGTSMTLGKTSAGLGQIAISGVTGAISYGGVGALTVSLSAAADSVTLNDTTTVTTINTGNGNDAVTVNEIDTATTINLGTGTDLVTVFDAKAALTVNGNSAGSDTLTLDLSATTAAVAAAQINDASGGNAVMHGFTTGDIAFGTVAFVNAKLGSGNDFVTVDTTAASTLLANTTLALDGGGGDDAFRIVSYSGAMAISAARPGRTR